MGQNGKIVFVVLHYENVADTEECIDSLIKYLRDDQVTVVVVDNGSKKEKADALEKRYRAENIIFLRSEDNLGFARGNNIGFEYAKNVIRADMIVLANNDLVFEQEDFVECLWNYYVENKFDVAGPKIISLVDGMNQNPVRREMNDVADVNKRIFKLWVLRFLNFFNLDVIIKRRIATPIVEFIPAKDEDFQLHGACMIFAEGFISRRDGLFDGTFMYREEDILKCQVERDGMKMLYLDGLSVKHKEGASTNAVHDKDQSKRRFIYKWSIDSCKKLKKLMLGKTK